VHGFNGLVGASLSGFATPIDGRVIATTQELGGDFKFNLDMNSGNNLGFGWSQSTILGAERSSSATAYLGPSFINRANLYVVVNAQVSRVIQTTNGTVPTFRGVEFRSSFGGSLKTLTAKKEVILSAGSIGTPHILLNSGIGNSTELRALGINPLVNLPDVGENLSDHSIVGNPYLVNSTDTFESIRRDPQEEAQSLQEWKVNKTGPYVATILDHIGFVRLNSQLAPNPDTAAGPNSAHYEMIVSNGIPPAPAPPQGNFLALTTIVVSPDSRGSVKLSSNQPFDAPLIDPGLLKSNVDKLIMREAVKGANKFAAANAWKGYVLGPAGPLEGIDTDAEFDQYVAQNSGTLFHPVGTASMSPKGANTGVVDPDLKVKKVLGLRVVDASIFPYVPSAHTQAPVYAVAERASDLIKSSY